MPSNIARIAYHEAGHAVAQIQAWRAVAHPLGPATPIRYVDIEPVEGKRTGVMVGSMLYRPGKDPVGPAWRDAMEWQITVLLAGPMAEILHCRAEGIDGSGRGIYAADIAEAEAVAQCLGEPVDGFAKATALLLAHWPLVKAIAEALMAEGCLDGDDVEALAA